MDGLLPMALLVGALALWLARSRSRERALRGTGAACQSLGVELLDQAVAPRGIGLRRDRRGRLRLRQRFVFEFTPDGERRLPGWTFVVGGRLESVHFGFPEGVTVMGPSGVRQTAAPAEETGNIIRFPGGPRE